MQNQYLTGGDLRAVTNIEFSRKIIYEFYTREQNAFYELGFLTDGELERRCEKLKWSSPYTNGILFRWFVGSGWGKSQFHQIPKDRVLEELLNGRRSYVELLELDEKCREAKPSPCFVGVQKVIQLKEMP